MDDSQEQEQPETQPSAAAEAAPPPEATSLGDRVREVREHLERASAALAALDQLLPASTQPVDGTNRQPDRSQQ
ncbi:hypothetical protein [Nocardioides sp.]|uniref:hypothetical protein n=1 Tax=Nocardioides sp. TaxID=35761 RepID=UPI003D12DE0F